MTTVQRHGGSFCKLPWAKETLNILKFDPVMFFPAQPLDSLDQYPNQVDFQHFLEAHRHVARKYLLICWSFRFSPPRCNFLVLSTKCSALRWLLRWLWWNCRIQWWISEKVLVTLDCMHMFLDSFGCASTVFERMTHPKTAEPWTRKCHVYLWTLIQYTHAFLSICSIPFVLIIQDCCLCKISMLKLWIRVRLRMNPPFWDNPYLSIYHLVAAWKNLPWNRHDPSSSLSFANKIPWNPHFLVKFQKPNDGGAGAQQSICAQPCSEAAQAGHWHIHSAPWSKIGW